MFLMVFVLAFFSANPRQRDRAAINQAGLSFFSMACVFFGQSAAHLEDHKL